MSRHRGAKPDRRYGLLDPIHMFPHFHGVQTISSSHTMYGRLACYLGRKVKGPARSLPNQSRAVRNPCTRRSSRRSSSVAQSLHVGSASITDQTHGIALFLRRRVSPRAHCACVFQLRTFGFHRCKPDFLSSAIAREGAYLLVKPVIPGVAFIR